MAAAAKGKGSRVLVWILLGLLVLGLAGFGVDSFGGSVRSIGRVGAREIGTTQYARALQQEIRAFEAQIGQPMGFAAAQALGIDRIVRQNLVTLAALDNEAQRIGLSVGDGAVQRELLAVPAFRGAGGTFDREAYRMVLQQNGYTEAAFEAEVRAELARTLLQGAVVGGVEASPVFADTLLGYIGERRAFRHVRLDRPAEPLPEPDDATLRAFYEANAAGYTRPEARRIAYAWLSPAMLADRIEVDEAALRAAYRSRIADYVQPERRLVERLAFRTEAEAAAAMARIAADEGAFADLVAERGLSLSDIDMGDVGLAELGAAGPAVFALEAPGVVGPLPSPLGPALYRMNGILAAQEVPFEEAREELRAELAQERARRQIVERTGAVLDLIAGGATLEDLAADLGMELGAVDYRADVTEGILAYAAFRAKAATLGTGAFPEVTELEDGSIAVLRLDGVVPAERLPFEEVVVRVIEDWAAAETALRLAADAAALVARVEAGAPDPFAGHAVELIDPVMRDAVLEGLPRAAIAAVFEMMPGEVRTVPGDGAVHVVVLDDILPVDPADPEAAEMRARIAAQAAQGLAQDLFQLFARALEREAGVVFDEAAINAVHAQFQ